MPGWYEHVRDFLASDKIQAIGVIQEQHPTRTKLLNQWKRMDEMRLLMDPLNRLDVSAVPITLLVDEFGVIRFRNPKKQDFTKFLSAVFENDGETVEVSGREWSHGDQLLMKGKLDEAIAWYKSENAEKDGRGNFRLGVAYRMRFDADGSHATPSDFQLAIKHWSEALRLNPNQYIWRRRIQQYGPVLDKPYPFYNWVSTARREIAERGEKPIELSVEPAGVELAGPNHKPKNTLHKNPDPDARINIDIQNAVTTSSIVVRSTDRRQSAFRIHLSLKPDEFSNHEWNNEAGPLLVWLDSDEGVTVREQLVAIPGPSQEGSSESRRAEFEVVVDKHATVASLKGYALCHVCNKTNGECRYVRKEFIVELGS